MDHIDAKNRSYEVRDRARIGGRLVALEEIKRNVPVREGSNDFAAWRPVVIAKGEEVRLLSESNAGFRGIEFSIKKADGDVVHGISAGFFAVLTSAKPS